MSGNKASKGAYLIEMTYPRTGIAAGVSAFLFIIPDALHSLRSAITASRSSCNSQLPNRMADETAAGNRMALIGWLCRRVFAREASDELESDL
jgi:hypothetical protein